MDSKHKHLLEKYWKAETSPDEEKELLQFLQDHEDEMDTGLFDYFSTLDDFGKIKADLPDEKLIPGFLPNRRRKSYFVQRLLWSAAAIILLLLGIRVIYPTPAVTPEVKLRANPETGQALALTREMLLLVSTELNKMELCTYPITEFGETMEKLKGENKEL